MSQLTVNLNTTLVGLNDRLRQRQAQTDALDVLGEPAAVKPFEDVVQILWVDAAARILYSNRGQAGGLLPLDQNTVSLGRVVQGVFQQISNVSYVVKQKRAPLSIGEACSDFWRANRENLPRRNHRGMLLYSISNRRYSYQLK